MNHLNNELNITVYKIIANKHPKIVKNTQYIFKNKKKKAFKTHKPGVL